MVPDRRRLLDEGGRVMLSNGSPECFLCGALGELVRHHINWHHWDNRPENVVKLCRRCHVSVHRVGGVNSIEQLIMVRDALEKRA